MKLPTWAIVVGVIMILFGGCGTLGNVQKIYMPQQLEMQKEMLEGFGDIYETHPDSETETDSVEIKDSTHIQDSIYLEDAEEIEEDSTFYSEEFPTEVFNTFFTIGEKGEKLLVTTGYIGMVLCLFYILAGIFMLLHRKESIRFAIIMLSVAIVFLFIQAILFSSLDDSYILKISSGTSFIGIIAHLALLTVILIKRKEYFPQPENT